MIYFIGFKIYNYGHLTQLAGGAKQPTLLLFSFFFLLEGTKENWGEKSFQPRNKIATNPAQKKVVAPMVIFGNLNQFLHEQKKLSWHRSHGISPMLPIHQMTSSVVLLLDPETGVLVDYSC